MSLYKNKYRVESTRLKNWDYSSNGYYYVTICTKNRIEYFGKIQDHKMILSEIGEMAYQYWREIPNHFSKVVLDEFVVMPNHVHGIIAINNVETPNLGVSTTTVYNLQCDEMPKLGVIINQFKRICTIQSRKINHDFAWQSRYYDHIIRDNNDLKRIREYIINNPVNWREDDLYVSPNDPTSQTSKTNL